MTTAVIITLCSLLLIAYLFDLTTRYTKIPSVILLLLLGWGTQQIFKFLEIQLPDFSVLLSVLGTIGLILIVLEGSLELEFNKSKLPLVRKSLLMALLPLLALAFLLSFIFSKTTGTHFSISLINVMPLCIISSAIAIPTVKKYANFTREFVIYESSFSDIIGVLLFNFILVNTSITFHSIGEFLLQLVLIILISFFAIVGLSYLLNKIEHHIKFMPMIIMVILIYSVSKAAHLPALLFILLFGLFLGNIDGFKRFKWIQLLKPDDLKIEIKKFKEIAIEATFLIRALFFILFGFLIQTHEILNTETVQWAALTVFLIFMLRFIFMTILKIPMRNIFFIAPRGLITILLFFAVTPENAIPLINKSLIIQVVVLSAFIMMTGLLFTKKEPCS